jgi:hypothetical protein
MVLCPTCQTENEVIFPHDKRTVRFNCRRCTQWITAELDNGGVSVSKKDAEYTPMRLDELCPNCKQLWELWFNPNGALIHAYGAEPIGTKNTVTCLNLNCGITATVSLS